MCIDSLENPLTQEFHLWKSITKRKKNQTLLLLPVLVAFLFVITKEATEHPTKRRVKHTGLQVFDRTFS